MGTQENLNKFKIGECHNVGNCTHIGERQAIPSDIANSGGFKCKYCGAQLQEAKKPKSFWDKYGKVVMITVSIFVLIGVGFGIYKLFLGKSNESAEVTKNNEITETQVPGGSLIIQLTITNAKDFTMNMGESKRLEYQAVPEKNSESVTWESSNPEVATVDNGVVTAIKAGSSKITAKSINVTSSPIIVTVKGRDIKEPNPMDGTDPGPKVSFGKYKGPANGLGGTIVVTRNYSLDLHDDGEPIQLSPGDEIQQTKFTNGELRSGVWIHQGSRRFFNR